MTTRQYLQLKISLFGFFVFLCVLCFPSVDLEAKTLTKEEAYSQSQAAVACVNQLRARIGLPELVMDLELVDCASVRAQESGFYFSHTRPNGAAWYTVNKAKMCGENLASGFFDAASAISALTRSPSHYANMVDPDYHSIGISIYQSPDGNWFWAQEFGM